MEFYGYLAISNIPISDDHKKGSFSATGIAIDSDSIGKIINTPQDFYFCENPYDIYANFCTDTKTYEYLVIKVLDYHSYSHNYDCHISSTRKFQIIKICSKQELFDYFFDHNTEEKFTTVSNDTFYFKNRKYHRVDGPAIIRANGEKSWFQNGVYFRESDGYVVSKLEFGYIVYEWRNTEGLLHRLNDKPAYITTSREDYCYTETSTEAMVLAPRSEGKILEEKWYFEGQLHRDNDLPAIIQLNGPQKWYKNGLLHRDGDLPAIVSLYGIQQWYKNNLLHRDGDMPAVIESNGTQKWYKNNLLHRDGDMPAVIEYSSINKSLIAQEWHVNGKLYRENNKPTIIKSNLQYHNQKYYLTDSKKTDVGGFFGDDNW
jgi:hypothetical protein